MATQKQFAFHLWVEAVSGGYVATCLETGLVSAAENRTDAVSKMNKLLTRTIEFAAKHDRLSDVFQPAPNDIFKKYLSASGAAFSRSEEAVSLDHCGVAIKQTAYAAANC